MEVVANDDSIPLVPLKKDERIDQFFKELEQEKGSKLAKARENLPIYDVRSIICQKIRENRVVMIKATTGSGKTTQVPQYILEDCIERENGSMTNILVTQPRRISALAVADRVAEERGEKLGKIENRQVFLKLKIKLSLSFKLIFDFCSFRK